MIAGLFKKRGKDFETYDYTKIRKEINQKAKVIESLIVKEMKSLGRNKIYAPWNAFTRLEIISHNGKLILSKVRFDCNGQKFLEIDKNEYLVEYHNEVLEVIKKEKQRLVGINETGVLKCRL